MSGEDLQRNEYGPSDNLQFQDNTQERCSGQPYHLTLCGQDVDPEQSMCNQKNEDQHEKKCNSAEEYDRCLTIQDTARCTVNEIYGHKNRTMLKIFRYLHSTKKTTNNRHNMAVLAFRYTILFRSKNARKLLEDTMFIQLRTKFIGNKFTTIIESESANNGVILVFNHLQKLSKQRKNF